MYCYIVLYLNMADILAAAKEFLGTKRKPRQDVSTPPAIERGGSFANAAALAACMAAITACSGDVDVNGGTTTDTGANTVAAATDPIGKVDPHFYVTEAGSHVQATGDIQEPLKLRFSDVHGQVLTVLTESGGTTEFSVEPGHIDIGGPSNQQDLECVVTSATDADGNPVTISPFAAELPGKTIAGSPVQLRSIYTEDPDCLDAFAKANSLPQTAE